jgi:hypothetical protein
MASELCVEDSVMVALEDLLSKVEVVDEVAAVSGCWSR